MTEYAPKGMIGVVTPQANTTVEAEMQVLCPPGYGIIAARLTSTRATMDARLEDYVDSLDETVARFANAPLSAVAFACTGASYIVDPTAEQQVLERIAAQRGCQVITAADAVAEALAALDARRVGVVSPYGDPLHGRALAYWAGRGFELVRTERLVGADGAFHPIYALGRDASALGLAAVTGADLDAVVILGTGLPTLATLLTAGAQPVPALSPNLALMWRAVQQIEGRAPDAGTLSPWVTGAAWRARFEARYGAPQGQAARPTT